MQRIKLIEQSCELRADRRERLIGAAVIAACKRRPRIPESGFHARTGMGGEFTKARTNDGDVLVLMVENSAVFA